MHVSTWVSHHFGEGDHEQVFEVRVQSDNENTLHAAIDISPYVTLYGPAAELPLILREMARQVEAAYRDEVAERLAGQGKHAPVDVEGEAF